MLTQSQIEDMWVSSARMKRDSRGLMYFSENSKEYVQEHSRFDSYEEYLGVLKESFSPRRMAESYVEECGREFPGFIRDKIIKEVTPAFADIPVEELAEMMKKDVEFMLIYNNPKDLAKDFRLENILDEIDGVDDLDGFNLEHTRLIEEMSSERIFAIPVSMSLEDYYFQRGSWQTAYSGGTVNATSGQGYYFSIPAYEIKAENAEIVWKNTLSGVGTTFLSFEESIFAKAESIELRTLIEIEIARVKKGEK